MKHLSLLLLLALSAMSLTLTSCSGNKSAQPSADQQSASVALDVDSLLTTAESLIDQQVTVEGVCTHTCKHGATKIFLQGSDNTMIIRCEAAELGSFSQDCVHNVVRVTGYVRETRMDEAYLQNWKRQYEEAMMQQQMAATDNGGDPTEGLSEEQQEKVSTATGCATESAARREQAGTIDEKIAAYREQIAARQAAEGKDYLSFFHIEATAYEVMNN